jgi:hypothetical protein
MSYYLSRDAKTLGPYSELELRTMFGTGEVQMTDFICAAGENQWRPLSTLLKFAPGPAPAPHSAPDQAIATIIPYKNPQALTAYYLAVFSLIPCFGLLLAIPALVLGITGLRKARENPERKGKAHAWTGIILGGLMILLWGGCTIFGVISLLRSR